MSMATGDNAVMKSFSIAKPEFGVRVGSGVGIQRV